MKKGDRLPLPPKRAAAKDVFEPGTTRLREVFHREGLSPAVVARFRRLVRAVYSRSGREFPWRETRDPYRITVSEFMLQQTQVERVLPKYTAFIQAFPDIQALAEAPLHEVLRHWQGLGYNRRAGALHRTAMVLCRRHGGVIPADEELLLSLPGIGPSTAGAVCAFAYGIPAVFIETNIRRVFIHAFFKEREDVRDREILPLVARTLDRRDPGNWYYGLMDFGSLLAAGRQNPNLRSFHYQRQSPFEGSDRQMRGALLRSLIKGGEKNVRELARETGAGAERVRFIVAALVADGLVRKKNGRYMAG